MVFWQLRVIPSSKPASNSYCRDACATAYGPAITVRPPNKNLDFPMGPASRTTGQFPGAANGPPVAAARAP
jgi:hypothetical protein